VFIPFIHFIHETFHFLSFFEATFLQAFFPGFFGATFLLDFFAVFFAAFFVFFLETTSFDDH